MFAIAVPQTVQLVETPWRDPALPPEPVDENHPVEPPPVAGSVSFDHASDDVSTCRMTVTIGEKTWTHTFGVGGPGSVESTYEDDAIRSAKAEAAKKHEADVEAERAREQEAAQAQGERELSTADDTTATDLSSDAKQPEPVHG